MHKKFVIIMLLVILSTGCARIEKQDNNYNDMIVNCLSKKIITNEVARGYKFYIPRGVKLIKNYDAFQSISDESNSNTVSNDDINFSGEDISDSNKILDEFFKIVSNLLALIYFLHILLISFKTNSSNLK